MLVSQHRLPEMPTQEQIAWPTRILNKLLIEMFAGDALPIASEADKRVVVLTDSAI